MTKITVERVGIWTGVTPSAFSDVPQVTDGAKKLAAFLNGKVEDGHTIISVFVDPDECNKNQAMVVMAHDD